MGRVSNEKDNFKDPQICVHLYTHIRSDLYGNRCGINFDGQAQKAEDITG